MTEETKALVKTARLKRYPKGQIIYYQGDELQEIFIIKSGVVKIYDIDHNGNEKVLHITQANNVIPYAFFSGRTAVPYWFYSALTDCELYVMSYDELISAMEADSKLAVQLMNTFSLGVHEVLVRLSSLGKTKAPDKLIATLWFLLTWHSKEVRNGWYRVDLPINHQLLADITGITRERAAMVMKELQDNKIIRNPKLTVLEINKSALEEASYGF